MIDVLRRAARWQHPALPSLVAMSMLAITAAMLGGSPSTHFSLRSWTDAVPNGGFESTTSVGAQPACWSTSASGKNAGGAGATASSYSGAFAERLVVSSHKSGLRQVNVSTTDTSCRMPAVAGTATLWFTSTAGSSVVVSYLSSSGWSSWSRLRTLPAVGAWTSATVSLPAPPFGSKAMSLGVQLAQVGEVRLDDVSLPTTTTTTSATSPASGALWAEPATSGDGLTTNEYAYWNPQDATAVKSDLWEMTSGSLFQTAGGHWTGVPDTLTPNATSSTGTNSAVFRLTTRRADFGDVAVSFDLLNNGLTTTSTTPAVGWDGVHVFLRYQSEESLYYASVNRRDGRVALKKKCPGGTSNGGAYYTLAEASGHAVPYGVTQNVSASVVTTASGVALTLSREGTRLLAVTDTGTGCPAITLPGKVGIRGDNDDFRFATFTVSPA